LLILASVSITTLFGQDGIITKAREAGEKTAEASQNEQEFLNYAEDYMNDYSSGTGSKTVAEKMADAGITGDPESLSDVVDGVPIPKDFTVSTVTGEKTKAEGLVIKDDNLNEFVWVPVKDLAEDGYIDDTHTTERFGRRTFGRSNTLGIVATAGTYTETLPSLLTNSVEEYGGFYIARYEASYEDGKVASKPSTTATTLPWANVDGRLWNDITQLNAIEVCSEIYASDAKVVGHLIYGAEWDSTLQWFKQTVFSNSDSAIGTDSTSWGNYYYTSFTYGLSSTPKPSETGTLLNTGVETTPSQKINNIYNMAGNLSEWTQEKYGTGASRTDRGGCWNEWRYGRCCCLPYDNF